MNGILPQYLTPARQDRRARVGRARTADALPGRPRGSRTDRRPGAGGRGRGDPAIFPSFEDTPDGALCALPPVGVGHGAALDVAPDGRQDERRPIVRRWRVREPVIDRAVSSAHSALAVLGVACTKEHRAPASATGTPTGSSSARRRTCCHRSCRARRRDRPRVRAGDAGGLRQREPGRRPGARCRACRDGGADHGVAVMFVSPVAGAYGAVGWISRVEAVAEVEDSAGFS